MPVLDMPEDLALRQRGEGSEEKVVQEQREGTALRAVYLTPSQVPDSPAEFATLLPLDQVDAQVRIMMTGTEVESLLGAVQSQHQQPSTASDHLRQPSVAELVGQLGVPQQPPQPVNDTLALAGLDLNVLSDPNAASQLSHQQLQQLLEMLGPHASAGAPTSQSTESWATSNNSYPSATPPPSYPGGEAGNRWEGSGSRGGGWRGRGRGRGRGGKSRVPCTFFLQGRYVCRLCSI